MFREITTLALCLAVSVLAACGSGLSPPASVISGFSGAQAPETSETGPPSKIVRVPGSASAVVALFPDGRAFYSPDGYNVAGGGSTVFAYDGLTSLIDIEPAPRGIVALLANGTAFFSPNGKNLGGGGSTIAASSAAPISYIVSVQGGIDAAANGGQSVYSSPDGLNLDGGGNTVSVYGGASAVTQIVTVGTGVVALLKDGSAYFSPNNRDLGGGGLTVSALPAAPESPVKLLVGVGGGVLAELENGAVYLSPDGLNLAGGGSTVSAAQWNTSWPNAPFAPRDSAHGVEFQGHLWLSGGFDDPKGDDSCFATCSYYDLWSSTDLSGTTWNSAPSFATATSPDPRDATPVVNNGVQDVASPTDFYDSYSAIVVWNNRLFAIGSTVWSSANGTDWSRDNLSDGSAAPGPLAGSRATENSRAFALGSTLFFLQPDSGEVYSTVDPTAATWSDLGSIPGFTPRCGETAFVFLNKLWIEGGGACDYSTVYNDIWSSPDGVTWTRSDTPAAWPARMWGCIANGSVDDIWMVGGYWPTDWTNTGSTIAPRYGENHSDAWYTKDGVNWRQFKADYGSGLPDGNALDPRHAATCYIDPAAAGQSLIVTAGSAASTPNEANEAVSNTVATLSVPAAAALP